MPLVTIQRSHLVAAGALAVAGLLAFRGPWATQAAATNANPVALESQQVVYVDQYGRPLTIAPVGTLRPLNSTVEPAYAVSAVRPGYTEAPQMGPSLRPVSTVRASATPRAAVRSSERGRSWKKSALVIGGSAGTGAGIGALIGGKKGAAIGAAIGGGSATLYEAIKR